MSATEQVESSTEKASIKTIISCGCKFFLVSFECQEDIDFFNEDQFKCPRCLLVLKVDFDEEDQVK